MSEYIEREAAIAVIEEKQKELCPLGMYSRHAVYGSDREKFDAWQKIIDALERIPAADVRPVPEGGIGEMSDGYHTFNGLYYQRMVLSAALVEAHKDKAWKSWRHEDGELCFGGDWFIVGIDTPEGSYTYHYEEKDWELFDCVELPAAKHWDGHTEKDVTRLLSLDARPVVRGTWVGIDDFPHDDWECDHCGCVVESTNDPWNYYHFCPNCGADMREES